MPDPFGDVKAGDSIPTDKAFWNAVTKKARTNSRPGENPNVASLPRTLRLLNKTGTKYQRYTPVNFKIAKETSLKTGRPVFEIEQIPLINDIRPFAVLQAPSPDESVVEAIVSGITPARVYVQDPGHEYCRLDSFYGFGSDQSGWPLLIDPTTTGLQELAINLCQDANVLRVKNTSGENLADKGAVNITFPSIPGTANGVGVGLHGSYAEVTGYADGDDYVAILQHAIDDGEFGWAIVQGWTEINITSAFASFRYLKPNGLGAWTAADYPTSMIVSGTIAGINLVYLEQMPPGQINSVPVNVTKSSGSGGDADNAVSWKYDVKHLGTLSNLLTDTAPNRSAGVAAAQPGAGIEYGYANRGIAQLTYTFWNAVVDHFTVVEYVRQVHESAVVPDSGSGS